MEFFELDQEYNLVVKDEIFLVPEFEVLLEEKFNSEYVQDPTGKHRTKCFAILKYVYLMYAWKSPNNQYPPRDRHELSIEQTSILPEWLEEIEVVRVIKKFNEIQETRTSKMLDSVNNAIDKLRLYFDNIDFTEIDPMTNKPIYTAKELVDNIAKLDKAYEGLASLETRVKKERQEKKELRGGNEAGMFDMIHYR